MSVKQGAIIWVNIHSFRSVCFLCSLFIPNILVEAKEHKLEGLYIHTYIHEDGSATITEKH